MNRTNEMWVLAIKLAGVAEVYLSHLVISAIALMKH
jgi:hypothetical protein